MTGAWQKLYIYRIAAHLGQTNFAANFNKRLQTSWPCADACLTVSLAVAQMLAIIIDICLRNSRNNSGDGKNLGWSTGLAQAQWDECEKWWKFKVFYDSAKEVMKVKVILWFNKIIKYFWDNSYSSFKPIESLSIFLLFIIFTKYILSFILSAFSM